MADKGQLEVGRAAPGWAGVVLVVVSTISIAVVPSLARIAYDGGTNTLTVITARSIVSVALTAALLRMLRQPFGIGRRARLIASGTGVLYAAMLSGYLGAVHYLPVNLVVLIYFIHPLLVGLAGAALGLERITAAMIALLLTALLGLGLAVGASNGGIEPRGVALAAMAMLLAVFVILGNAEAGRTAPALSVCFHMMVAAALVLALPLLLTGAVDLPDSASGWAALVGVAVLFTMGTLTFFAGMAMIGATRAAMISNLEPILGVGFALVILNETLTLLQTVGVVLVIGSIFAMEYLRASPQPRPQAGTTTPTDPP